MKSGHANGKYSAHPHQLAGSEAYTRHVDVDLFSQRPGKLDQAAGSKSDNFAHRQGALPQLGLERQGQFAVVRDLFVEGHVSDPNAKGVPMLLLDIEQHLVDLVLRRDDLGVGLITALVNNQVGEFPRQVYVGGFQRAAQDRAAVTGVR